MSNEVLDGGAVREVERLAREAAQVQKLEVGGRVLTDRPMHDQSRPVKEAEPETLRFHTLESLAEYVRGAHDRAYRDGRAQFLHVESPTAVRLVTGLFGGCNQRVQVARAEAVIPAFPFGQWMDPEAFVIALQSHFEQTSERASVLALVGGLKDESVRTLSDDGVTQEATARRGLNLAANVRVPNPVTLRPWRTFTEVPQVESPFVLRLRGGGDGKLPTCALFEADGGTWRLTAIQRVKSWLRTAVPEPVIQIYG